MIDWVTAVVPVKHRILCDGHGIVCDRDGIKRKEWLNPYKAIGSHDSNMRCKTQMLDEDLQHGSELYIHGNPSKFLQGHNVVGSDNLNLLVADTVKAILATDGQTIDTFSYNRILRGDFIVHRLDINYMYELPSQSDVSAWISAAAVQSSLKHRGMPRYYNDSIYWGLGSQLWFVKAYSKFTEMKSGKRDHRLPYELVNTPLFDYSRSKLRIELQLNAKECARIAKRLNGQNPNVKQHRVFNQLVAPKEYLLGSMLPPETIESLFNEYVGRIEMNTNVALKPHHVEHLPSSLRGTYAAWLAGHNMQTFFASRTTYYRHRKEIMRLIKVDISIPSTVTREQQTNVVPLVRVLEAKPASIPENLKQYCVGV